jgi:transposase-like protein
MARGARKLAAPDQSSHKDVAGASARAKRIASLYVTAGKSTYQIARELGIDRQRVTRILHNQGIAVFPKGKGRSRPRRTDTWPSEEELRRLYVDKRMTTPAIGRLLGTSDRRLRSLLGRYGIERRHSGSWDREDRSDVGPSELEDLYVCKELSADAVGSELGVSRGIVLRAAHNHGVPVRPGGSPAPGTADIELIVALYEDPTVLQTLRSHRVPIVSSPGTLCERFPQPVSLTPVLLEDLYVTCGLSSFQIELVTGHPSLTILRRLRSNGVARRPPGGLSPFMVRWRKRCT